MVVAVLMPRRVPRTVRRMVPVRTMGAVVALAAVIAERPVRTMVAVMAERPVPVHAMPVHAVVVGRLVRAVTTVLAGEDRRRRERESRRGGQEKHAKFHGICIPDGVRARLRRAPADRMAVRPTRPAAEVVASRLAGATRPWPRRSAGVAAATRCTAEGTGRKPLR